MIKLNKLVESSLQTHYDDKIAHEIDKIRTILAKQNKEASYDMHDLSHIIKVPHLPLQKYLVRATVFNKHPGVDTDGTTVYFS
jgi:hypothetical protein